MRLIDVVQRSYLSIQPKFDEEVTLEEAAVAIKNFIKENGIPAETVILIISHN